MGAKLIFVVFCFSTLVSQSSFAASDYTQCTERDSGMVEFFPGFPLDQQPQEVCGVFGQRSSNGEVLTSRVRFNTCQECREKNGRCVTTCFQKVARCLVEGQRNSYVYEFREYGKNIDYARDSAAHSCTMTNPPHSRSCSLKCCTEQAYETTGWTVCR